jgi:hypothetical protein
VDDAELVSVTYLIVEVMAPGNVASPGIATISSLATGGTGTAVGTAVAGGLVAVGGTAVGGTVVGATELLELLAGATLLLALLDTGAGALVGAGVGVSAQDIKTIAVKSNNPARMTRVLRFILSPH